MARAEVRFLQDLEGRLVVSVERAPAEVPRQLEELLGVPDGAVLARLGSDPLPEDAAREAGEALYRWLEGTEGTRRLLDLLRGLAPHQAACPLFLELVAPGPKELPWELLRDPDNGFLALDGRWPVCRRVNPVVERELGDQVLEPPLRIAAVLSAAGIDASGEWRALKDAVAAADAVRLPVRLRVAVGEPELFERVKSDLELLPGGGEVVTVASASALRREILDFRPHLLHFFCHGTPDHGGVLHLASPGDHAARHPTGRVTLGREDFEALAGRGSGAWLVTLNACDSGRTAGTHALTERIAEAGFPAVIGMREPVRFGDAHVFTGALYRDLLRQLEERAAEAAAEDAPVSPFRELDFASLLLEPRRALAERHSDGLPFLEAAAHRKEWSLPVLFVRPEPLRLAVRPVREGDAAAPRDPVDLARLQAKIETLVTLRDGLAASPDTPPEKLARLDRAIDDLTDQLLAA